MKLPAVIHRAGARRPPDEGSQSPSVGLLTLRVALTAAIVVGLAYLVIAAVVANVVSHDLLDGVDQHLTQALSVSIGAQGPDEPHAAPGFDPSHQDPRGPPVLLWIVTPSGQSTRQGLNELALPNEYESVTAPITVTIDGATYRLAGRQLGPVHLVVAQSLDSLNQTESTLLMAELGIGLALLACVFIGALAVGRRVAMPIERARQTQLEFTADASHELRTPLSVIEAQTSLALARKRDAAWDGRAFARIDTELRRTRRLVDDMLWLARFDSAGRPPDAEPVDLAVLAAQTADRFAAVAESRGQRIDVHGEDEGGSIVTAPPEWLDRLVGVLLDNALKYSPEGGAVSVDVAVDGRRIRLRVDDSGPGIPEAERNRIFDRFHRATDAAGGSGLGLAIGDAIVRSTGGRWRIGVSSSGGASVAVSWPRAMVGQTAVRSSDETTSGQPAAE